MDDLYYYKQFISGNDEALAFLVEKYNKNLILYITSYTKNHEDAEDIVADVFLKLFIKKPHFNGDSSFKTWLYRIAINETKTRLKKEKRYIKEDIDEHYELSSDDDIEEEILDENQKDIINAALERIHSDYKTALKLMYYENFSIDDICKIMNKNKKQVNNLLFRGKSALKRELEKGTTEYKIMLDR